jgi:hypothetical protein
LYIFWRWCDSYVISWNIHWIVPKLWKEVSQSLLQCVRYCMLSYVPYRTLGVSIRSRLLHARTHARLQATHDVDMLSWKTPFNGSKRHLVVLSEVLIEATWQRRSSCVMVHLLCRRDGQTHLRSAQALARTRPGRCEEIVGCSYLYWMPKPNSRHDGGEGEDSRKQ